MKRVYIFGIVLLLVTNTGFGMPSFQEVRSRYTASDAVLLDRHGKVIHELRVDPKGRRLEWTALDRISPALVGAVVRSEDKRFYDHHGADWKALLSSALGNLFSGSKRGASTITMQLASILDGKLKSVTNRRTMKLKWKQINAAQELEHSWTKDQILEAYLNLVAFRGELDGITAGSRGIFDKDPGGLDEMESAILASLIRSPNASPEKVSQRAVQLASSLHISVPKENIKKLAAEWLSRPHIVRRRIDLAPFVAHQLLRDGRTKAVSTLDASIQRFASETLEQAVGDLSGRNVRDGGVLVVENRTGDVLAYVGNSGRLASAVFVDGIRARRQAGSTLKPFLYGLAIEQRLLTAASLIEDAPIDLPTARGIYRPENYDREFRGVVSARNALASSMNIPAVKTLGLVGNDSFVRELRSFGFTDLSEAENYGLSLALGSADITLWELVNAYRTLANGGVKSRMRLSNDEPIGTKQRVLSSEASFIISNILSDREARSATFSLENSLATRYWTAVKTGTSKDMRDNWCIGYSQRYTVGVWVGNFSGAPMWDVSGVSGAAPVWLEIMNMLHRGLSSTAPIAPQGVVLQEILMTDQDRVTKKREWFIAGTESLNVVPQLSQERPKIIYPAPGTIIAADPDIPEDLQKIFFEASPHDSTMRLVLDDVMIGSSPAISGLPRPGMHKLSLLSQDGSVADQITFEIR